MSKWITHRRPTEEDAYYGDGHLNGRVYVTDELGMTRITTWTAAARQGLPWQPFHRPAPYVKPKHHFIIDIIEEWANGYGLEFSHNSHDYDKKTIYEIIRRAPINIDLTGMDSVTPELKKILFDTFTETFDEIKQTAEANKMKCVGMYPLTVYPHVYFYIRIDESVRYEQDTRYKEVMI